MERCVICNQKIELNEAVHTCKDMVLFKDGHAHSECAQIELARPYSLFVIGDEIESISSNKVVTKQASAV